MNKEQLHNYLPNRQKDIYKQAESFDEISVFERTQEVSIVQPNSPVEVFLYFPEIEALYSPKPENDEVYYMEQGEKGLRLNDNGKTLMDYNWNVVLYAAGEDPQINNIRETANRITQKLYRQFGEENPFAQSMNHSFKTRLGILEASIAKDEIASSDIWEKTLETIDSRVLGADSSGSNKRTNKQKMVLTSIKNARNNILRRINTTDNDEGKALQKGVEAYLSNHIRSQIKKAGTKKIKTLQDCSPNQIIEEVLDKKRFSSVKEFADETREKVILKPVEPDIQDKQIKDNKVSQSESIKNEDVSSEEQFISRMLTRHGLPATLSFVFILSTYHAIDAHQQRNISFDDINEILLSKTKTAEVLASKDEVVLTDNEPQKDIRADKHPAHQSRVIYDSYQTERTVDKGGLSTRNNRVDQPANSQVQETKEGNPNNHFQVGPNSLAKEGFIFVPRNIAKYTDGISPFPIQPFPIKDEIPQKFKDTFNNWREFPYTTGLFRTDYENHSVMIGHNIEVYRFEEKGFNQLNNAFEEGGKEVLVGQSIFHLDEDNSNLVELKIVDARETDNDKFFHSKEIRENKETGERFVIFRLDEATTENENGEKVIRGLGLPYHARKDNQVTFIICSGDYNIFEGEFENILVVTTDIVHPSNHPMTAVK
jgi:hypothetical protein